MMQVLAAHDGTMIHLQTCDLIQGNFVKLQPQSVDFLDISDPKAV
jgi:ubiquitin fusion degradation protein 1